MNNVLLATDNRNKSEVKRNEQSERHSGQHSEQYD